MSPVLVRRLAATRPSSSALRAVPRLRSYATPVTATVQEQDPQLGDYPALAPVSKQNRPPTGWWDNQMRRNFGELPHEKEEILSMWGPDEPHVPPKTAIFHFGIAVFTFVGIAYTCMLATPDRPAIPREYPFSGLVKELGGLDENKAIAESLHADGDE